MLPFPPTPAGPYDACEAWLASRTGNVLSWSGEEFAEAVSHVAALPPPRTVHERQRAAATAGRSVPGLARTLRDAAPGAQRLAPGGVGPDEAARRLEALWRASARIVPVFNGRGYLSFLTSGRMLGVPHQLLTEIVLAAVENPGFDTHEGVERVLANGCQIALAAHDAELLKRLLDFPFSYFNWGSFAKRAGEAGWRRGVRILWNAAFQARAPLEEHEFASFVQGALAVREPVVLGNALRCSSFNPLNWATFARHAGDTGESPLVRVLCECAREEPSLDSGAWAALARAVGTVGDGALLEEFWASSAGRRAAFDARAWEAFVGAAAVTGRYDLAAEIREARDAEPENGGAEGDLTLEQLRERVQAATAAPHAVTSKTWGALAKEVGQARDAELLHALWEAREAGNLPLNGASWGSFADAAGRVGDGDLLERIWVATWQVRATLGEKGLGAFGYAARRTGQATLLEAVWRATEPERRGMGHPAWGTFVSGAAAVGTPALLLEVFRSCRQAFDPTLLPHWGTLFRPLLEAAWATPDPAVGAEIAETVRGQRADLPFLLRVMRDVAPAPLAGGAGRFEGACRCLTRYLVNSHLFKSPDLFRDDVHRVVDGVLALPADRQDAAWVRLLGQGQEAYGAALRARYAERFHRATGLGSLPWHRRTPEERMRVVEEIRADDGVAMRVRDFVADTSEEHRAHVMRAADPGPTPGVVEFLVENHLSFLQHRRAGNAGAFFSELAERLGEAGAAEFGAAQWRALFETLITEMAARIAAESARDLQMALHDVHKVACHEAYQRLGEGDLAPEEEEKVAAALVEMLRVFELDITRVATPARDREPVNIASDLARKLAGARRHHPAATVQIPPSVPILVWKGARSDEVLPLLGSIRSNCEWALRVLPDERQHFLCVVEPGPGEVRLTVENACALDPRGSPLSTGLGLASIRRRVHVLGGRVLEEGVVGENGDARYRLVFTLPAPGAT